MPELAEKHQGRNFVVNTHCPPRSDHIRIRPEIFEQVEVLFVNGINQTTSFHQFRTGMHHILPMPNFCGVWQGLISPEMDNRRSCGRESVPLPGLPAKSANSQLYGSLWRNHTCATCGQDSQNSSFKKNPLSTKLSSSLSIPHSHDNKPAAFQTLTLSVNTTSPSSEAWGLTGGSPWSCFLPLIEKLSGFLEVILIAFVVVLPLFLLRHQVVGLFQCGAEAFLSIVEQVMQFPQHLCRYRRN